MPETPGRWLRPPRLRTPADEEDRRATAYELFVDLVFVAAVSQVATALSRELTVSGFLRFTGLYVAIAWAWGGFTFYANRFEDEDVAYRLVEALAMLAIAAAAITVHSVMRGEGSVEFAVSYAVTRACLLALYLRARHYTSGDGRRLVDRYLAGFGAGALLWLVSIAAPEPGRYWLWGAAIALELATPLLGWRPLRGSSVNVAHITDRFGAFFIIVLGESVVAVVAGVAGTHFSAAAAAVAVGGFVIALCLWWIYFDLADTSVVGRGMLGLVYVYAHIPLLGGVAAFAAGTKIAITHADASSLSAGPRWAMCGGLACYLLSLATLHLSAQWTTPRERAFIGRLVASGVLLVLAAAGGALTPVSFMLLLAATLIAQLVLELLSPAVGAASVWAPGGTIDARGSIGVSPPAKPSCRSSGVGC
jgi:low temperature requirement protein LtrA